MAYQQPNPYQQSAYPGQPQYQQQPSFTTQPSFPQAGYTPQPSYGTPQLQPQAYVQQPAAYPAQYPQPGQPTQVHVAPEKQVVQSQPKPTQGMMVTAGGNRNAKNLPVHADGREWSHGLCDCCGDVGTCCLSWFCPCIVYAQNKQRFEHLTRSGKADPTHGGSGCSGDCWVHGLLTGCCGLGWVLQISPRGAVRARYNIKGGGCGDCCAAFCCTPCQLTQESREIELEEQSLGYRKH